MFSRTVAVCFARHILTAKPQKGWSERMNTVFGSEISIRHFGSPSLDFTSTSQDCWHLYSVEKRQAPLPESCIWCTKTKYEVLSALRCAAMMMNIKRLFLQYVRTCFVFVLFAIDINPTAIEKSLRHELNRRFNRLQTLGNNCVLSLVCWMHEEKDELIWQNC